MPSVKGKPKTFLGISKQPHYENVWSNIYAFFLRVEEVHDYKDLFIKSLVNVIHSKWGQVEGDRPFVMIEDFEVITEVSTIKNGRIDILLSNPDQAIIIENKVYHYLNNNLDDYWNSVLGDLDDTALKVGVILSLHPISKDKYSGYDHSNKYVNITHLELMKEVMKNRAEYEHDVRVKYQVFLEDFNQNVINMSKPEMEEKELSFYLKNQSKINGLVRFKKSVYNHVVSEVENAGLRLDNYTLDLVSNRFNHERLRYYVSKVNKDLMFTIIFGNLLNEKCSLEIIIDVKNELLKFSKQELLAIPPSETYQSIVQASFKEGTVNNWAHYAYKIYHHLTSEQLAGLADFILEKLEKDGFIQLMKELEKKLEKKP